MAARMSILFEPIAAMGVRDSFFAAFGAREDQTAEPSDAREMADRLKATGIHEHAERMAKTATPAREITDRRKTAGVYGRLGDISARAGEGSRLADAIRGIEKQQGLLDDLTREPIVPTIPDGPVLENPIVEINRKLDRIEKQFSQISVIARDSAQVAADLQAYAAEFLQKFEKAAEDANQSDSKAIQVGGLALAIAIVVGAGKIFAPTLIHDQETETLRQKVVDLNGEVDLSPKFPPPHGESLGLV